MRMWATIAGIGKLEGRWTFTIRAGFNPGDIREGDSIAVNGVCLTVTGLEGGSLPGRRLSGDVEPDYAQDALDQRPGEPGEGHAADSRLGGHIVMGHVDGIGRIVAIGPEGDSLKVEIETPAEISRYIVKKGSVAIDGISLTVNDQRDNRFTLNVIPYSAAKTTIGSKNLGDHVNVETDILGRYVEKFVTR